MDIPMNKKVFLPFYWTS